MTNSPMPLSINQEWNLVGEEVYSSNGWHPTGGRFPLILRVTGDVSAAEIEQALNVLVERHETLRTTSEPSGRYSPAEHRLQLQTFRRTGIFVPGLYIGRLVSDPHVSLHQRRLTPIESLRDLIREEVETPLETGTGPLMRATLVHDEAGVRHLVVVLTHRAMDGWSCGIFVRELLTLVGVRGSGPQRLPPPTAQYSAFAHWQREAFDNGHFVREERYWERVWATLGGAGIRHQDLPFARPGAAPLCSLSARARLALSPDDTARLTKQMTGSRLTPYLVFRTAMAIALHYYTGKRRLAFWGNFANRQRPEFGQMLGWCSNTHLVPVEIDGRDSFAGLCRRMAVAVREAQKHEALPLGGLWHRLGRNLNTITARVSFDLFVSGRGSHSPSALEMIPPPDGPRILDLDVRIHTDDGIFALVSYFDPDRYTADGVAGMLATMRALALQFATMPNATIASGESLVCTASPADTA